MAISVLIRLGVGAGLAAAAGSAHQVTGPFGALAVGIAAPLLVEQLARQIPVSDQDDIGQDTGPIVPAGRKPVDDETVDERWGRHHRDVSVVQPVHSGRRR